MKCPQYPCPFLFYFFLFSFPFHFPFLFFSPLFSIFLIHSFTTPNPPSLLRSPRSRRRPRQPSPRLTRRSSLLRSLAYAHRQHASPPPADHLAFTLPCAIRGRGPSTDAGRSLHLFCTATVPYVAALVTDHRLCSSLRRFLPCRYPSSRHNRSSEEFPTGHGGGPAGSSTVGHGAGPGRARVQLYPPWPGMRRGDAAERVEPSSILPVITPNRRGNL
jgi:hypothetical protein